MKKIIVIAGVAVLSTLGAFGARSWYRSQLMLAQTRRASEVIASLPAIVPVKVRFQETLRVPGKPDFLSTDRDYAVRSDGSVTWTDKQYNFKGELYLTHWNMDLRDGTKAHGDDATHAMTAVRVAMSAFERAMDRLTPGSGCTARANGLEKAPLPGEHENIAGVDTVKIVVIDDQRERITKWRAPTLNCLDLRQLAEFKKPDGSIGEVSDTIAVSITPGEPDPALFVLPSGMENVSYAEHYIRQMSALKGAPPDEEKVRALRAHDSYFEKYRVHP